MTQPLRLARRLTVLNHFGLYARSSALIVKACMKYTDTRVRVRSNETAVSGRSIMGLLTLEGYQGRELLFEAEGPHARELIEDVTRLFNEGFLSDEKRLSIPAHHADTIVLPEGMDRD